MKVISVEQFLSTDKKVQDEIMKWWEPQMMDLYVPLDGEPIVICRKRQLDAVRRLKNEVNIPLLTVGQLIDFVEQKTGFYLGIEFDADRCGYEFDLGEFDGKYRTPYVILLNALWDLAQYICTQSE